MLSKKSLPILLLSAADSKTAKDMISKLIDSTSPEHESGSGLSVWRLENKYYTADVDVRGHMDEEPLQLDTNLIEAHIIHLSEKECAKSKDVLERRATCTGAVGVGEVRLVLVDASEEPAGLQANARRRQYEVVTLRPRGAGRGEGDSGGEECAGWERVREALQAHMWSGLCMRNKTAQPLPIIESPSTLRCEWSVECSSSDGEGRESDEEGAVERAELFATALELLPGARGGAGSGAAGVGGAGPGVGGAGPGVGGSEGDRRRRAEELVTAFCRALGHDLDVL